MSQSRDPSDMLAPLLAAGGDAGAFADAAGRMDWRATTASDYVRAVRLALAAGAHLTARELATQGAERFAYDPELANMARVLAPPKTTAAGTAGRESMEPDRQWLRAHWQEYHGRWVALRGGELLAHASSAGELRRSIEPMAGVLILRFV